MGKRGPSPRPTKLKVLHGDKPSRINDQEPVPGVQEVQCPDWLDIKAKGVWHRLAPDLIQKGVLTHWDRDLFARFCALEVINRQAFMDVAKRGVLVPGRRKGDTVKNPSLQIVRDTSAELRALGARFGLTPADRSQLKVTPGGGDGSKASRLLS